jgi:hypothetical protein
MPASKSWSLVFQGNVLSEKSPIGPVFGGDESAIPSVILRFEFPPGSADPAIPLFKGSLQDAVARAGTDGVPPFFTALLNRVALKKDLEGIYRKSGLQTNIDTIVEFIDHNTDTKALVSLLETQAGHDVACVVKQYIRTLAPSIIPIQFSGHFKESLIVPNVRHSLQLLKVLVTCIPTPHYQLLKEFSAHIEIIVAADNQMNIPNIALVLGGNFFRTVGQGVEVVNEMTLYHNLAGHIFEHWRYIFLNEPLVLNDRYVITKRDVTLPKCVVPTGHRMKFIDKVSETEVKLEYSGLGTTVAAADVQFVDDDASPPAFWEVVGDGTNEFLTAQILEPVDVTPASADALISAVRNDLLAVSAAEKEIGELPAIKDPAKRAEAAKVLLSRLAQV